MSESLTQKHLELLNRIATSPPPIDTSQMVTKLRRPSLEDMLPSEATATKASNRVSMSGIYVRSRPTSFSEFDMAFDPNYDYADLLARPISPTAIKETITSLGLRLQHGQSLFMQLSELHGQLLQDESTSAASATVVAPATGRPPRPTRPLPTPEGPPPGYVTVMSSGDGYESDGEEIVYMLENYKARHQCMVVDAKGQAPDLPLPATPKSSTALMEEQSLPEGEVQAPSDLVSTEAISVRISAGSMEKLSETAEVSADNTFDVPQKIEHSTSRANKRMGVLGIQAISSAIKTPMVNSSLTGVETNSRMATRTRASSKSVTFAPDTRIKREPKASISKTGGSRAAQEIPSVDAIASKVSTDNETLYVELSAADGQDQIRTPAVEVFEVDFADLEKANATSIVDGASGKKIKKKHHFGVYKVIRNVLKRNSGEPKVEKPTSTVVEGPVRSKTPTPSIATTVGGRPNVLRKPDPATKAKSAAPSVYSVSVAADAASQKSRKPFRAWSIRSGKGGRKGVPDPVQFPAHESITGGTGLLAPSTTCVRGARRRSASFSGFATIATPSWDDPVEMDQLLKDAAERLKQNPKREWIYKPKADSILEQGENPIDVGFVLERHVAV